MFELHSMHSLIKLGFERVHIDKIEETDDRSTVL